MMNSSGAICKDDALMFLFHVLCVDYQSFLQIIILSLTVSSRFKFLDASITSCVSPVNFTTQFASSSPMACSRNLTVLIRSRISWGLDATKSSARIGPDWFVRLLNKQELRPPALLQKTLWAWANHCLTMEMHCWNGSFRVQGASMSSGRPRTGRLWCGLRTCSLLFALFWQSDWSAKLA